MCTHVLDIYQSLRRSVDSHGATVLLFSAALRLHGLPSRSPITMPRSSAATLSYLRFDVNAYLQSTRITIDSLGTLLTLPVSFLPLARKVCSRVKVTENLAFRDRSRNLRLIDRFCETGRVLFLPTTDLRSLIREKDYYYYYCYYYYYF